MINLRRGHFMKVQQKTLEAHRVSIRQYTHADEATCVKQLLTASSFSPAQRQTLIHDASLLVEACRANSKQVDFLDAFMQEFSLSSEEGIALMCLAESLLRIPDQSTADDLIAEKVMSGDWSEHLWQSDSLFVNTSTLGLMFTGRVIEINKSIVAKPLHWLKTLGDRISQPVIRKAMKQAMKLMGQHYVLGRNIEEAVLRGQKADSHVTRFSFDMLGEGARTMKDAETYYQAYLDAIKTIGKENSKDSVVFSNGISVKLSALHPRYEIAQKQRVMNELLPRVKALATEAKKYNIGFSIDAEEADRLELSLDIFQALANDENLCSWDGLGFVLQAYNKRAVAISDYLIDLARITQRKFMVRLVKGAYWDSEIKHAQEQGYRDYPVYTRKANTDLSYQICSHKLLSACDVIFPQFASHNAYTIVMVMAMANSLNVKPEQFELQRLHGMGDLLCRQLVKANFNMPYIRVYAPVGAHEDLLPYLVRRLLENGANSSFVNKFMDKEVAINSLLSDVELEVERNAEYRHSAIPLPIDIFRREGEARSNTLGIDLDHPDEINALANKLETVPLQPRKVGPIVDGHYRLGKQITITSQADHQLILGYYCEADENDAILALTSAYNAQPGWNHVGYEKRAFILEQAADSMEAKMADLIGLIVYEAGRTLPDAVAEVREAVDFLRYYALQARQCIQTSTGSIDVNDRSDYSQQGCGVFFCISPWNFPLAIFTGQIAAALVAGNSVIAKPADTTPLIAAEAINILHKAGVPYDVLHFLPGNGRQLGAVLNADSRLAGVVFTGSTGVAQTIQKSLSERQIIFKDETLPVFIAETGGQNAMIVDSSALLEQVIDDVISSAFLSAGQRCSALRILYIQEEIADALIAMLKEAMNELSIGAPWQLETDVGPVINEAAALNLQQHIDEMQVKGKLIHACKLPKACNKGIFFAPHLIALDSVLQLKGEVFGPILHVIRFSKRSISTVINDINNSGFGLTLGIHSRIQHFAENVIKQTRVGNNYINRNMVGAVVGVNPFGGQGLSGTGPKAGGPHYLKKLTKSKPVSGSFSTAETIKPIVVSEDVLHEPEKTIDLDAVYSQAYEHQPGWDLQKGQQCDLILRRVADNIENTPIASIAVLCRVYAKLVVSHCQRPLILNGPTGEINQLSLHGRGIVFCRATTTASFYEYAEQLIAALVAGNAVITTAYSEQPHVSDILVTALYNAGIPRQVLHLVPNTYSWSTLCRFVTQNHRTSAIALCGSMSAVTNLQKQLVKRGGAITPIIFYNSAPDYFMQFMTEKTITTNIVATGGNTQLLNLVD